MGTMVIMLRRPHAVSDYVANDIIIDVFQMSSFTVAGAIGVCFH